MACSLSLYTVVRQLRPRDLGDDYIVIAYVIDASSNLDDREGVNFCRTLDRRKSSPGPVANVPFECVLILGLSAEHACWVRRRGCPPES
jgi:hypothetical protein